MKNFLESIGKEELKKKIVELVGIILFILFICSIFDKWNQIWYEFGQNIYKLKH